jgi:hypothetical protein
MDPSEFEGIVSRISDPLSLNPSIFGDLEQLLSVKNSNFINMDITKGHS